jgi:hypothetical protein
MYWNHSWLNNFNNKLFFNKLLFIENILLFIFSEKIFGCFLKKKTSPLNQSKKDNGAGDSKLPFFRKAFLFKKNKKITMENQFSTSRSLKKRKTTDCRRFNFTKFWFVKYNTYLLVSTFVFFYFKVKPLKKKLSYRDIFRRAKIASIFFKKKKGDNFKKKSFFKTKLVNF